MSVKESLGLVDQVLKSDLVFAAGADVQSEVEGIRATLASFLDGVGPCERQVKVYSKFFQACLKKMENYISTTVMQASRMKLGSTAFPVATQVFGLPALEAIMQKNESDSKDGKNLTLRDLQVFRTYDWMLTPAMREQASKWIQTALQFDMKCPSQAISDKARGIDGEGQPGGSSSSASQLVSVPISKKPATGSSSSKSDIGFKKGAMHTSAVNVMAFFAAKPK
jgi:hypothetical protein